MKNNVNGTKLERMSALFGAILIFIALSNIYVEPNISVYVVSYYRLTDNNSNLGLFFQYQQYLTHICCFAYPLGAYLIFKYDTKKVLVIGAVCTIIGWLGPAFIHSNKWLYMIIHIIPKTLGFGILYYLPFSIIWSYYPKQKGLITGIIQMSDGLSGFMFNILSKYLCNPDNLQPTIMVQNGQIKEYYYDENVASNVPSMFTTLGIIWSVVLFISYFFCNKYIESNEIDQSLLNTNINEDSQQINKEKNYKSILCNKKFFLIAIFCYLSQSYLMFFFASFKNIGDSFKLDDQILTYSGSIGELLNSFTRIFWGFLCDKYSPVNLLIITIVFQLMNIGTVYFSINNDYFFGIYIIITLIQLGAAITISTLLFEKIYRQNAIIAMSSTAITIQILQLSNAVIYSQALPIIGYFYFFLMYFITNLISLFIIYKMKLQNIIQIDIDQSKK